MLAKRDYQFIGSCVAWVVQGGFKTATKYISPKLTVKATRVGTIDRRCKRNYLVVTVGAPNYKERIFIKHALKTQERFPIHKIQLKSDPKRKVK